MPTPLERLQNLIAGYNKRFGESERSDKPAGVWGSSDTGSPLEKLQRLVAGYELEFRGRGDAAGNSRSSLAVETDNMSATERMQKLVARYEERFGR